MEEMNNQVMEQATEPEINITCHVAPADKKATNQFTSGLVTVGETAVGVLIGEAIVSGGKWLGKKIGKAIGKAREKHDAKKKAAENTKPDTLKEAVKAAEEVAKT